MIEVDKEHPLSYFILACFSLMLNLFVVISAISFDGQTCSSRLVIILHIALIVEIVVNSPIIFSTVPVLCHVVAAIIVYTEMVNLLVCISMAYLAHQLVFCLSYDWMNTLWLYLVFTVFPLFSFLPLIDGGYGVVREVWCGTSDNKVGQAWYAVFFSVYYVLIFIACVIFGAIVWKINKSDTVMVKSVFSNVGMYVVVTLMCWIPKILIVFDPKSFTVTYVARIFPSIAGILYSGIFFQQKRALALFAKQQSKIFRAGQEGDEDDCTRFSEVRDSADDGSIFADRETMASVGRQPSVSVFNDLHRSISADAGLTAYEMNLLKKLVKPADPNSEQSDDSLPSPAGGAASPRPQPPQPPEEKKATSGKKKLTYEEQHWKIFSDLDSIEEAEMLKLAQFMQILLERVPTKVEARMDDVEPEEQSTIAIEHIDLAGVGSTINSSFSPSTVYEMPKTAPISNKLSLAELILHKKVALIVAFEAIDRESTGVVSRAQWAEVMQRVTTIKIRWLGIISNIVPEECLSPSSVSYRLLLASYSVHRADGSAPGLESGAATESSMALDALYGLRKRLEAIFNFFDTNGDGVISREEFRTGCASINERLPEGNKLTDIDHSLDLMDFDGNGMIDINVFFETFRILDVKVLHMNH